MAGKEVDINNSDKLPDGIVKDSDWTLGAGKDAVSTLTIKFTMIISILSV